MSESVPPFVPVAGSPAATADDQWFPTRAGKVLIVDGLDGPRPLTSDQAAALGDALGTSLVLGRVEGEPGHWWTADVGADFDEFTAPVDGLMFTDLRSMMATLDPLIWNIAGRATQIGDWYRDNQRCGRCGGPMQMSDSERSMTCPVDGFSAYPRLSPAVIVLVEHPDGRALLARNIAWSMPMYSTLAGFIEPGESLEDCIHREIMEEVAISVADLRYFDSQSWPFPNSLMLGFFATYVDGEITPAPDEIADAQWFAPSELPKIPPRGSIARALIDDWVRRGDSL